MNYEQAFQKVVTTHGASVIDDPFFLRCVMMDEVKNNPEDSRLLDAFLSIKAGRPLLQRLRHCSCRKAAKLFQSLVGEASANYSSLEYARSLDPLLRSLYPKTYRRFVATNVEKPTILVCEKSHNLRGKRESAKSKKVVKAISNPPLFNQVIINLDSSVKDVCVNIGTDEAREPLIVLGENQEVPFEQVAVVKNEDCTILIDRLALGKRKKACTIFLPRRKYNLVRIEYRGKKKLDIKAQSEGRRVVKEMSILSFGASTCVKGYARKLVIHQVDGEVFIDGKTKSLDIQGTSTRVECSLHPHGQKDCLIQNLTGDIHLSFDGIKPRPKINRLFRTLHRVDGKYRFGNNLVTLHLRSISGRVFVR